MAMDAMWNPHKPRLEGEHFLGELFASEFHPQIIYSRSDIPLLMFFESVAVIFSKAYLKYGLLRWEQHMEAIGEDTDKIADHICDLDHFWRVSAPYVSEYVVAAADYIVTEVPDEIMDHTTLHRLNDINSQLIALDNVRRILEI
jgi:hypothetical protein